MTQIANLASSDTFSTRRSRINVGFVKIANLESTVLSSGTGDVANTYLQANFTANSVVFAHLSNTNTQIATKISNSVSTTVQARNIIPETDDTYSLGSAGRQWKDVFVGPGSLYVNGKKVIEDDSGTISITTDEDQSLTIKTSGTGVTTLQSATPIAIAATLQMAADKRITDADGVAVEFGDALDMNSNKITELGAPAANSDAATKLYVDTEIADLANSAPTTLNTLNELAAALGDDANFSTTVTTSIASKLTSANVAVTVGAGTITTTQDDVALNDEALVNPAGFLTFNLGGTTYKLPYFS